MASRSRSGARSATIVRATARATPPVAWPAEAAITPPMAHRSAHPGRAAAIRHGPVPPVDPRRVAASVRAARQRAIGAGWAPGRSPRRTDGGHGPTATSAAIGPSVRTGRVLEGHGPRAARRGRAPRGPGMTSNGRGTTTDAGGMPIARAPTRAPAAGRRIVARPPATRATAVDPAQAPSARVAPASVPGRPAGIARDRRERHAPDHRGQPAPDRPAIAPGHRDVPPDRARTGRVPSRVDPTGRTTAPPTAGLVRPGGPTPRRTTGRARRCGRPSPSRPR